MQKKKIGKLLTRQSQQGESTYEQCFSGDHFLTDAFCVVTPFEEGSQSVKENGRREIQYERQVWKIW